MTNADPRRRFSGRQHDALYADSDGNCAECEQALGGVTLNVLSCFSGIGALDLGLERAGMRIVGHVERDPFCQRVLAKHWPEVPQHDDVNTAPEWWAAEPRPRVHVVAGGPPCQGHSVAGKQLGTGDERWGWPGFRDVLDSTGAPIAVIENVPNLTRTGLRDILEDLADRGFDAWWIRVPAAAFGAPHLRWRLVTIAAHPERIELRLEPGGRGGASWESTSLTGFDGSTWSVADPAGIHGGARRSGRAALRGDAGSEFSIAGLDRGEAGGWLASAHWPTEPDVGRVVNGTAVGMDRSEHEARLRTLGNAVVPHVGEYIGRLILASIVTAAGVAA
jgi:DNA (cytosine-5)-methyltransferase 1